MGLGLGLGTSINERERHSNNKRKGKGRRSGRGMFMRQWPSHFLFINIITILQVLQILPELKFSFIPFMHVHVRSHSHVYVHAHDDHLIDAIVFRSHRKQQNHYFQVYLSPRFTYDDYREANVFLPPVQLGHDLCETPTNMTLGVPRGSYGSSNSGSNGGGGKRIRGRHLTGNSRGRSESRRSNNNDNANANDDRIIQINTKTNENSNIKNNENENENENETLPPTLNSLRLRSLRSLRSEKQQSFWWDRYSPDIALLVRNGTCSLETKARNAMALNEYYTTTFPYPDSKSKTNENHPMNSTDGVGDNGDGNAPNVEYGPRISYILLYDDDGDYYYGDSYTNGGSGGGESDNSSDNDNGNGNESIYPSELDDMTHDDYNDIDILYIEIHPENFAHLLRDMRSILEGGSGGDGYNYGHDDRKRKSMILNKKSFYPIDDPLRNTWSYNILIRQIEIGNHDVHFLLHWRWIYLITAIVLSIPILRTCVLIYFVDRRLVVRRNDRGWITGVRIERIYLPPGVDVDGLDFPPGVNGNGNGLLLFPLHLKDTLTKEQVEQLPLVEYGVTNLKKAVGKYLHIKNGGIHNDSDDDDDDDDDGGSSNDVEEQKEEERRPDDENVGDVNSSGNAIIVNEGSVNVEGECAVNDDTNSKSNNGNTTNNRKAGKDKDEDEDEDEQSQSQSQSNPIGENNADGLTSTLIHKAGGETNDDDGNSSSSESDYECGAMELKNNFIKVAYTSCIACSVCICDFTHGEELRLLPRCGHMFHEECLLPWLTERKNSCPLCQTTVVIHDEIDDTNSMVVLNDDDNS